VSAETGARNKTVRNDVSDPTIINSPDFSNADGLVEARSRLKKTPARKTKGKRRRTPMEEAIEIRLEEIRRAAKYSSSESEQEDQM